MSQIAELEARKADLQIQFNNSTNTQERQSIIDELRRIDKQISDQNAIESASPAEAQVGEFDIIGYGETTFLLSEITKDDFYYDLLKLWLENHAAEIRSKHEAIVSSYKAEVEALSNEVESLDRFRARSIELDEKLADTTARHQAAATQLEEANEEIRRLKQDNESLRKLTEAKAQPVTNTNSNIDVDELKRRRAEEDAKKPAITNKRWKVNERGLEVRTHYTAELVDTGEPIDIPLLEINRYREVSAEEANRFRAEAAEKANAAAMEDSALVSAPSLTLSDAEVPSYSPDGEVANEAITAELEQRLSGIEARLFLLEQSQRGVA